MTLNWRAMSCLLTKVKKRQCLMTLPQKGQNMTCPPILGQCIIYKDKTKGLIACNHTQDIDVWQQGQMTRTYWMSSCPRWMQSKSSQMNLQQSLRGELMKLMWPHKACMTTWSSLADLHQHIKVWKEGHSYKDIEASHSQDGWCIHTIFECHEF